MDEPKYKPLTLKTDRVARAEQEQAYREKWADALRRAEEALSQREKDGWLDLAEDWRELADEVRDGFKLDDAPPLVRPNRTPQDES